MESALARAELKLQKESYTAVRRPPLAVSRAGGALYFVSARGLTP